ncbi:DUF917 domain-containing protein [Sciscionella sediminilitoris]|uniref:DUF917 domain-containing protein n=1 Tax=Sciscionella sediminilitoris TaxID=1445613 RepID=UPI0004DFB557|nr:DUF917 domain-containing protein [Sciscionella sp. SE31]
MLLTAELVPDLALGCAVLGSGGGGSTSLSAALAAQAIEECGPVQVCAPGLLPADTAVFTVSQAGSTLLSEEMLGGRADAEVMREALERLTGRVPRAVLCAEIGGFGGPFAVAWAARLGLPLFDADAIGRAYPRMDQNVFELAGLPAGPALLCDGRGRTVLLDWADGAWLERFVRASLDAYGGQVFSCDYPVDAGQVAEYAVGDSVSRALRIGAAVRAGDPDAAGLRTLATAKVTEVGQYEGHTEAVLSGVLADADRLLRLVVADEYLAVFENGEPLAMVPDVITLLGSSGPVSAEELRYGQRVTVVTARSAPAWYTPAGLALGGPEAFGVRT